MTCNCKNSDGTKAEKCNGTCGKSVIIQDKQERPKQERPSDLIYFEEIKISLNRLYDRLNHLQCKIDDLYKKGYSDGFSDGFNRGYGLTE